MKRITMIASFALAIVVCTALLFNLKYMIETERILAREETSVDLENGSKLELEKTFSAVSITDGLGFVQEGEETSADLENGGKLELEKTFSMVPYSEQN